MLLLAKFRENKLSKPEMAQLAAFLNSIGETELDEELTKLWDKPEIISSEENGKSFVELKRMLRERHSPPFENGDNKNKYKLLLYQGLKYAAVIAITFGFTWFFAKQDRNLQDNQVIAYHEFIVPLGSKSKLILADSTEVWLNSGSRIKYPSKFSDKNRSVYFEGEAFFNVKHNPKVPFIVKTDNVLVKVYGTRFNLKSFPDEKIVETALVSGSLSLTKLGLNGKTSDQLFISPNQIARYSKETGEIRVSRVKETAKTTVNPNVPSDLEDNSLKPLQNIELLTAWKDNKLVFRKANPEQLIRKLERWYGVEVLIRNEALKQYSFTGTFENETIEQALNALKVAYPFKYTIEKNVITIDQ